ncbi:MAG TPA: class I SAM-dependent methyltransferase [Steroidobacteraceae bacterium]|nr:class I SAM-dependent methyltransferase [Steroidobacteraceae bacterium]
MQGMGEELVQKAHSECPAIRRRSENARPPQDLDALVLDCARQLGPNDSALAAWHSSYVAEHHVRIAFDLEIAHKYVSPGSSVLEVGSIPLLFTSALSRSGYRVTGCDLAPERYSTAIRALDLAVVKCDVEREALPFETQSFDAVAFNELFEHLRINPIFTLREVFRVLKTGGSLMLSSPNLRSLDGIVNFLFKNEAHSCCEDVFKEYMKLEEIGHMGHVREYTTNEVVHFLERIGFEVTDVIYRGELDTPSRRLISSLWPNLRPFVSYIARRPATT